MSSYIVFFDHMQLRMKVYVKSLDQYILDHHALFQSEDKCYQWKDRQNWIAMAYEASDQSQFKEESVPKIFSIPPSPPTVGFDQYMAVCDGEPVLYYPVNPEPLVLEQADCQEEKEEKKYCRSLGFLSDPVHPVKSLNMVKVMLASSGLQTIEPESKENATGIKGFFFYIFNCFFQRKKRQPETLQRMVYVDGLIKSINSVKTSFVNLREIQEKLNQCQLKMIYCQLCIENVFDSTGNYSIDYRERYKIQEDNAKKILNQYHDIYKLVDAQMNNLSIHSRQIRSGISASFRGRLRGLLSESHELTKNWKLFDRYFCYQYQKSYDQNKAKYNHALKLKLFLDTKVIKDIERYMKYNLDSFGEIKSNQEKTSFHGWYDLCQAMDDSADKKKNKNAFSFFYSLMHESNIYIPGGPLSGQDILSKDDAISMYQPNYLTGRPIERILGLLSDPSLKEDTIGVLLDELTSTIVCFKNLNESSNIKTRNAFRFLLAKILRDSLRSSSQAIGSLFKKNYYSIDDLNDSGTTLLQPEAIVRILEPLKNIKEISWLKDDPLLGLYDVCVQQFKTYHAICNDIRQYGTSNRSISWRTERRYAMDVAHPSSKNKLSSSSGSVGLFGSALLDADRLPRLNSAQSLASC